MKKPNRLLHIARIHYIINAQGYLTQVKDTKCYRLKPMLQKGGRHDNNIYNTQLFILSKSEEVA